MRHKVAATHKVTYRDTKLKLLSAKQSYFLLCASFGLVKQFGVARSNLGGLSIMTKSYFLLCVFFVRFNTGLTHVIFN
jgi:hypothetical protein